MGLLGKLLKRKRIQYELVRDENGLHQIGGEPPADFKIPSNEFVGGYHYLGFIDNTDPVFSWLPFKLHLIHPIYIDDPTVFLDYSDPSAPIIISPADTASSTSAFDEVDKDSRVIWEGVSVSLEENDDIDDSEMIGLCGEPEWLQGDETPVCPKSGKNMQFLCQLGSFSEIKATYSNVVPIKGMAEYFEQLNFWCDGDLYIFVEPSTRTVCYTMQNT